ncbi:(E2-independent) E3 ubiquitin-conjugating enzyme FATS isoform X3 [Polypterus senegalus]|uniref:(E2-independent) E3 ubiquitin-conjugating enzyme FATS isoform X3 n=1 Tax=Polypterus senegalus TaxID=55291 RepID=UPI001966B1A6|nr:(E2-independent) E3 ubiquitin-conjugating enzyme FATS isoform X3 [Polypterus senegalus]
MIIEMQKLETCVLPENHKRMAPKQNVIGGNTADNIRTRDAYWKFIIASPEHISPQSGNLSARQTESARQRLLECKRQAVGQALLGKVPLPISHTTVSLPDLHNESIVLMSPHQKRSTFSSLYNSLSEKANLTLTPSKIFKKVKDRSNCLNFQEIKGPPISENCLKRSQIRIMGKKERVLFCTMDTVKQNWLPVQKKAVTCYIESSMRDKESSSSSANEIKIYSASPVLNKEIEHWGRNWNSVSKADVFAGKYCSSITFSSGRSTDGFPDRNVLKYKASSSENVDSLDSRLPASGGRRLEKSLEKKEALSLKSAFIYSYNPNKKEFLPPSLSPQLPNEQLKTTGILTSSNENVLGICSAPVDYKTSTSRARKGFSSITITARRLIPPVNVPPTFSGNASLKQFSGDTPFNSRSFHTSENCLDDMCYRRSCKSRNVRKVNMTASRNNYSASEGCSGTERIEHKSSQTRGHNKENEILLLNTDGKKEFSAKSPKGLVHSCVYFRVSPHLSQANFYLDKPLFIPILGAKPSYAQQKHRSTFSLYVNGTSTKQTLNATNALLKEVTSKKETGRQNDKKESSNVKFKKEATALSSSHYRLSHFFRNTPQENATSVTCELLKKSNMLISDETDNCLHMIGQHVRNHCMVNGPLNEVQDPQKEIPPDLTSGSSPDLTSSTNPQSIPLLAYPL